MINPFRKQHLLAILQRFENLSAPLDLFLSNYFRNHKQIGAHDRRDIADTAYTLIRWRGLLDHLAKNKPSWESRLECYKDFQPEHHQNNSAIEPHIRVSFPRLLFSLLSAQYGEEKALQIAWTCNTRAPLTIRANTLKISREELLSLWQERYQIVPCSGAATGIHFHEKANLMALEEFKGGFFEIQDEGSQEIAALVEAKPKDHLLDFCAGSGGKTLAIAPLMQNKGQIYLHDIRASALLQAKKRLNRAGVQNVQFLFPGDEKIGKLKGRMDWVVVDAPCSGSGTLRRNPDMKWKFSLEMLHNLVADQRNIAMEAIPYVRKNGHFVYITCSILEEENEKQLAWLEQHLPVTLVKKHSFLPQEGGRDGFFGLLFRKNSD